MAIKGHTYLSEPVAKSVLNMYELSESFILSIYASIYYAFHYPCFFVNLRDLPCLFQPPPAYFTLHDSTTQNNPQQPKK